MTFDDMLRKVLEFLPDAMADEGSDGEITIHTGMRLDEYGELVRHVEPCYTCNYDQCQCDAMYDNYKDSLLERYDND